MLKSYWKLWCLCLAVLFTSHSVLAEDVREAWRADFNDGHLDGASKPVFISRSKESEPDRLVFRSQDGVITLGGQFDNSDGGNIGSRECTVADPAEFLKSRKTGLHHKYARAV